VSHFTNIYNVHKSCTLYVYTMRGHVHIYIYMIYIICILEYNSFAFQNRRWFCDLLRSFFYSWFSSSCIFVEFNALQNKQNIYTLSQNIILTCIYAQNSWQMHDKPCITTNHRIISCFEIPKAVYWEGIEKTMFSFKVIEERKLSIFKGVYELYSKIQIMYIIYIYMCTWPRIVYTYNVHDLCTLYIFVKCDTN
jgi:hypothetical protein